MTKPGDFEAERRPVRILGIDPAARTSGFAVLELGDPDRIVHTESFTTTRGDLSGRMAQLYSRIGHVCEGWAFLKLAGVETVHLGSNPQTTITLGAIGGVVRLALYHSDLMAIDVSPAERCKALGIPVKSDKRAVIRAVNLIYSAEVDSHDQADAVAIAAVAAAFWRRAQARRRGGAG